MAASDRLRQLSNLGEVKILGITVPGAGKWQNKVGGDGLW